MIERASTRLLIAPVLVALGACELSFLDVGSNLVVSGSGGTSGSSSSSPPSGGSGGAMLCTPGATQACYSGPAGTEGQGICKAGTQVCAPDGMSFGACAGEVLPQAENCATPEDEDCDGKAPPCKCSLTWAKGFGGIGDEHATGVVTDPSGGVVVSGYFSGSLDFGGGPLVSAGGQDIFVAKLDANGGHLWSKRFGDASDQGAGGVAMDAAGNALVVGPFTGTVDFGGGPLVSTGEQDVFVAKFDANGSHLWSKRFGDSGMVVGVGVAVDGAGNAIVTGNFVGSVDFGGGALASAGGWDVFVVKLDANGGHLWSKRFGDSSDQIEVGVAVGSADSAILVGSFTGSIDFGGGALASAGGWDVFVAKLDASGGHQWSKRFGDSSDQNGWAVGADATGNVLIAGDISGIADFGGGALVSAGARDIFAAKLDTSGGHVWSKRFGDASNQSVGGAAIDSSGNVVLTGSIDGSTNFGDAPLQSAGGGDVVLAKLASGGAQLCAKRFGDGQAQQGTSITTDSVGSVVLTGSFHGSVDFGAGPLTSVGGSDIFVAKLTE